MVIHDKGYFFVEKAFTCSILKQRKCKPVSITISSIFSFAQITQDLDSMLYNTKNAYILARVGQNMTSVGTNQKVQIYMH